MRIAMNEIASLKEQRGGLSLVEDYNYKLGIWRNRTNKWLVRPGYLPNDTVQKLWDGVPMEHEHPLPEAN